VWDIRNKGSLTSSDSFSRSLVEMSKAGKVSKEPQDMTPPTVAAVVVVAVVVQKYDVYYRTFP